MALHCRQCFKNFLRQCKLMCYVVLVFLLPALIGYVAFYYAGTINQGNVAPYHKFNGENAAYYLKVLTDTGPRVVGSFENQYDTVHLLFKIFDSISDNRTLTTKRRNALTYELQTASACFAIKKKMYGKLSCYRNINNVVAMVHPIRGPYNESILVNCHFDTVPTSPGVSDNGLNCAIMLEVMRILVESPEILRKNVIFLYNGAEEVGLLGSHAFVTQHRWVETILCFVNLDACGAGGRPILFQTGPKFFKLVEIFSNSVADPHASVIGEEIFQSGLIPSDTDFRIFRDYGRLKGLDIAHYANGYVYHTKYDDMKAINDFTIQHAGDNLISLVHALTSSIVNYNTKQPYLLSDAVYFDLFGYMLCWTEYEAYTYQYITVIFSFLMAFYNLFRMKPPGSPLIHWIKHLLAVGAIILLSYFSAIVCGMVVLFLMSEKSMLWFKDWTVIVFLYFVPTIVIMSVPFVKYQSRIPGARATHRHVLKFMYLIQMIWTVALFFGTVAGIRSSYILLIYLFPLTARAVASIVNTNAYHRDKTQIQLTCLIHSINFFYLEYLALQFYHLIIPITGRLGASINPEFIIGMISIGFCLLMFSLYMPLLLYFDHKKVLKKMLTIIIFSVLVVIIKSSQNPFGERTPQRFTIVHCEYANATSMGRYNYIIYPTDYRGSETLKMLNISNTHKRNEICERETFCAIPIIAVQSMLSLEQVVMIDVQDPILFYEKPTLKHSVRKFTHNEINFASIHLITRDFTNAEFVFTLHESVKLYNWTLLDSRLSPIIKWKHQEIYFMTRHCGIYCNREWPFTITLQVPNQFNGSFYIKIAKCNHFTAQMNKMSENLRNLLDKFPKWTHVVSWSSIYQQYII